MPDLNHTTDSSLNDDDHQFMHACINLGLCALSEGEFPAACIIVKDSRVIASTHNSRHSLKSKIAHAEMLAIKEAESMLGEYLAGCVVYANFEPCLMCFAALCACRASRIVFGAFDVAAGIGDVSRLPIHYQEFSPLIIGGCLEHQSYDLVRQFSSATGATWPLQYYRAPR